IYGQGAGVDEPSILPTGGRDMIHSGNRQPSKSAPPELDLSSPRVAEYRVPRTVVGVVGARAVDFGVFEGVKAITAGGRPGDIEATAVAPGVIVAGTNPV